MKKKNEQTENSKSETFEHLHNKKPVTRRDFLSTGLLSFSASLVMPTWLQILASAGDAQAADLLCKTAGASEMAPFIGLKLSGGAALSANFIPFRKDLQPLSSYSKMGMGLTSRFSIVREFSNSAPFYAQSELLAGIRTAATAPTLAKSTFIGVCVRSQDDSMNNRFDVTGLVAKSGMTGKILPNLGRSNTPTGANQVFAYLRPAAPLIVGKLEDVNGALSVAGSLGALSAGQKTKMFQTLQSLTANQSRRIASQTAGETLGQLLSCANNDNTNLISNPNNLNVSPLSSAPLSTLWGINAQTSTATQNFVFATMVFNAINGNAGTVNLDIGGYDYHNNTRTSGDQKDREAGVVIGRILQSFALLNKKGFIVVTSDGSVSSPDSDDPGAPWVSDRGSAGVAYIIAYDPAKAPVAKSFQIGQFTDPGQAADDNFLTGGNPELAAGAIFANYLAFNNKLSTIEQHLPRVFSNSDLDQVVKIVGS